MVHFRPLFEMVEGGRTTSLTGGTAYPGFCDKKQSKGQSKAQAWLEPLVGRPTHLGSETQSVRLCYKHIQHQ